MLLAPQINAATLKDRDIWAAGWLQRSEMENAATRQGVTCRACSGSGIVPCAACDATGAVLVPVTVMDGSGAAVS